MLSTNTRIRRLVCAVALALTALAASATGAGASTTVSDANAKARAQAFVPGVTDFPSRLGDRGERAAEARLAQRSLQGVPVYVQTEESAFDWSAAATGALAATLLLLGAALAVRMARRTRVAVG